MDHKCQDLCNEFVSSTYLFRPAAARKFVDEGITSLEGYYCSIFAVHMSFYIVLGLMSQTYNLILIISTY